MKIELLDQPVLIVKSLSPYQLDNFEEKEALQQIEYFLEEEISQIRDKISSGQIVGLEEYFTTFNLHLQTENEVSSVVLESEWKNNTIIDEGENPILEELPPDVKVSELMRVAKITYSDPDQLISERKKLLQWLISQSSDIPIISGLNNYDYLLFSAKDILNLINSLKEFFGLK
jgi:hypothetical protein